MQYYKVVNNEPISEDLFFWKFEDSPLKKRLKEQGHRQESPPDRSKSPGGSAKSRNRMTPTQTSSTGKKSPINSSPYKQDKLRRMKPTRDRRVDEELKECTFKPSLVSDNARYWNPSDIDFLRRCELWQEQRQSKLIKQRQQEIQETLKECTFQPKISETSKNIIFAIGLDENQRYEKLSHQKKTHNYHHAQLFDNLKHSYQPLPRTQEQGLINQYQIHDKHRYEDAVTKLHRELHKIEINLDQ